LEPLPSDEHERFTIKLAKRCESFKDPVVLCRVVSAERGRLTHELVEEGAPTACTATVVCQSSARYTEQPRAWLVRKVREPPPSDEKYVCHDVVGSLCRRSSSRIHKNIWRESLIQRLEPSDPIRRAGANINDHYLLIVQHRAQRYTAPL
jgi:hypothetical protein